MFSPAPTLLATPEKPMFGVETVPDWLIWICRMKVLPGLARTCVPPT